MRKLHRTSTGGSDTKATKKRLKQNHNPQDMNTTAVKVKPKKSSSAQSKKTGLTR